MRNLDDNQIHRIVTRANVFHHLTVFLEVCSNESGHTSSFTGLSDIAERGITLQANFTAGFLKTNDVAVVDNVHKVGVFSFVPQETVDV